LDWNWVYMVGTALLTLLGLWIWKPWAAAYTGEKAKNLARKEDLDKILAEVRAVTAATEAIKADITGGLWQRQMFWSQKRDLYIRLLGTITDLHDCHNKMISALRHSSEISAHAMSADAQTRLLGLGVDLHNGLVMAGVFASRECLAALMQYLEDFSKNPLDTRSEASHEAALLRLSDLQARLVRAAKKDLGSESET
jgi:hypothetical protein